MKSNCNKMVGIMNIYNISQTICPHKIHYSFIPAVYMLFEH